MFSTRAINNTFYCTLYYGQSCVFLLFQSLISLCNTLLFHGASYAVGYISCEEQ